VGLCVGASFWGIGSDIMGRRLAFNLTLLIASVFGIAAGAAPSWWVFFCIVRCCARASRFAQTAVTFRGDLSFSISELLLSRQQLNVLT
jgi:MFS family permease